MNKWEAIDFTCKARIKYTVVTKESVKLLLNEISGLEKEKLELSNKVEGLENVIEEHDMNRPEECYYISEALLSKQPEEKV